MEKYKMINGVNYNIADSTKENNNPDVCFLVEGKYYRLSKGAIVYDHYKKRYVLKSAIEVENGFISIREDDKPVLGSWSWPTDHLLEDNIVANYEGQKFLCISDSIFENTGWEERLSDGEFYLKSGLPVKEFSKIVAVNRDFKYNLPYNASNELKRVSAIYASRFKPTVYNKGVSSYPQVLGKYTYGFEFETTKGKIPNRICNKLGLIPLRDGSIDGIEYATIPLEGKDGIETIIQACEELEKRTVFDQNCSLHIHIGGMPRTEKFFIAMAKVLCYVQEEMYEMFPFYTRGGFGLKKKDYTAPLPVPELLGKINNIIDTSSKKDVDANFQHIFEFLSMGHKYYDYKNNLANVKSHPSDPGGTSKWYVKSRYRWVNMIPLLFGNKKTIEFRIHTPTYDANKIVYFAIMCASLIDFAVKQEEKILKGNVPAQSYNLSDLVYNYLAQFGDKYAAVHDHIHNYIVDRKSDIKYHIKNGNLYGKEEELTVRRTLYKTEKTPYTHLAQKGDIERILNDTLDDLSRGIQIEPPRWNNYYGGTGTTTYRSRRVLSVQDTPRTASMGVEPTTTERGF